MRTRMIGSLEVSVVGLGCNNFGGRLDYDSTAAVVHSAIDAGITFFDTADIYGGTKSEEFLGRALGARRDEIVLATKFGMQVDAERKGAKPDYVPRALEDSLRRLQTDHIDLYQLHAPDPTTPIADTLGALDECVRAGKVKEIGCSNFTVAQLQEAESAAPAGAAHFVSVQNQYSLLHRDVEGDVLPECERAGLSFLPYFPLASGVLTGKYRRGEAPPAGARLSGVKAERGPVGRRQARRRRAPHRLRPEPGPDHGGARHRLDRGAPPRGIGHRRGDVARAGRGQCRRRRLGSRRRRAG